MKTIDYAIIASMCDTDLYKLTMGQVVLFKFPDVMVTWRFTNRGKTSFPEGFADELNKQIQFLSQLEMPDSEARNLEALPFMKPAYVAWFKSYKFDPSEVKVVQTGGDLDIEIGGFWHRNIYWEVPLMAIISELYFEMTGNVLCSDWAIRIVDKAMALDNAGSRWSDFGSRRRRKLAVQDEVVRVMRMFKGFQGTSNPYLAFKYGVPVVGTSAHEAQMVMSALFGVQNANRIWLEIWSEFYRGLLGIALTDTYTTDVFLRDFDGYMARLYDGVRHDSNDPIAWGEKMIAHYLSLKINPTVKRLVFSDNLNVPKYIDIHKNFDGRCIPSAGIGTHFTNDCGAKPLNIVIKISACNGIPVVKLSDDLGKASNDPDTVRKVKEQLNIL